MKLVTLTPWFSAAASCLVIDNIIPGAEVFPASDGAALERIGAQLPGYPDRRTVTIRSSKTDDDDISSDFLWGMKVANHGGRLLLKKGETYIIGKKLDLTFLNDIEVQLDGEIQVRSPSTPFRLGRCTNLLIFPPFTVHKQRYLLASEQLLLRLPGFDFLLEVGWSRYQDLRPGYFEWQRSDMVQ